MDTLRDRHIAARSRFAVALHEFLLAAQNAGGKTIWVFEGRHDIKYYGLRIRHALDIEPIPAVDAKGKENVLRLYDRVRKDEGFTRYRVAFFLDRDFGIQRDLDRKQAYVTPCYSIENLYATSSCFERILREEFGLSSQIDREEIEMIRTCYETWLTSFGEQALTINAWMKYQLNDENNVPAIALSDLCFDDFFHVTFRDGRVITRAKYTLATLEARYPSAKKMTLEDLDRVRNSFEESPDAILLASRGKFVLTFLVRVLAWLVEESSRSETACAKVPRRIFRLRRPVALSVHPNSALSVLSRFADTPPCLNDFLAQVVSS